MPKNTHESIYIEFTKYQHYHALRTTLKTDIYTILNIIPHPQIKGKLLMHELYEKNQKDNTIFHMFM